MPYKLLVADDEAPLRALLQDAFSMLGYTVFCAASGREAVALAGQRPDLILLDVNMPDMDGFEVCRRIREHVACPILFLTARVEDADKIEGFSAGGDDYVLKPFSLDELEARVAAHLRRQQRAAAHPLAQVRFEDDLAVDYAAHAVTCGGRPVPLAKKEYEILELLSRHAGQIFDRERIYEALWGCEAEGSSAVVAEHIKRLRAKLAAAGAREHIETKWGMGYRWIR
ncbi:response regulator transcription factor [Anaerofilum sp. BX8]|uniref:Stage 0 sporulation protein A homolog n=1 Tax=Anaerofilum hominis TaxID=2763016 RepID=A0A923KWR8_9FIRM|nr:response regulator transcription factor [Anaerofilum hominis]MBC5582201.1 response regulator transcription factor [Anaerofilum hominis]